MQSLLVASAGGHLEELWMLRPRLAGIGEDVTWVTWDTPQSRSMLAGEQRVFIDRAQPRDVKATLANLRAAHSVLSRGSYESVVSTGSLPAVPFLALARARGIGCHFIESAARMGQPSLSGKIVAGMRGVRLYSQYEESPGRRWSFRGSVFDGFAASPAAEQQPAARLARVVVSVGSSRYSFRGFVEAAQAVITGLPAGCEVLWQTGHTDVGGLGIDAVPFLPSHELAARYRSADAVICHAGVGSALGALAAGRCPVLVPRRRSHGEHVDDHQARLARELAERGLAVTRRVADLDLEAIYEAAGRRIEAVSAAPPFELSR